MDDLPGLAVTAYLRHSHSSDDTRLGEENRQQANLMRAGEMGGDQSSGGEGGKPAAGTGSARYGNGALRITEVKMLGADGRESWVFEANERVRVRLCYEAAAQVEAPVFSILVHRDDDLYVTSSNTYQTDGLPAISGRGWVQVEFPAIELARGSYLLSVGAYCAPDPPLWADPGDFHDRAYRFHIESAQQYHGVVAPKTVWRLLEGELG